MTTNELGIPVNITNRDPRVACALVFDTSGSMLGQPIQALRDGYDRFRADVQKDPVARKRAEIAVVTFGSIATLTVPFQEARSLEPVSFSADGLTDMAAGITLALDELEGRKRQYQAEGIEYFRPWLFLLSDGAPNPEGIDDALERLNATERAKKVTVFPVGVGEQVDWDMLNRVSVDRPALKLAGLDSFAEMFLWLSASLSSVSSSSNYGADDAAHANPTQQIALPSIASWANAY